MKVKKGLWVIAAILVILIGVVFYMRDDSDMEKVNQEQLKSAEDSLNSKIDQLNMDMDLDLDDEEIEDATLAYDTLQ